MSTIVLFFAIGMTFSYFDHQVDAVINKSNNKSDRDDLSWTALVLWIIFYWLQ